MISLKKQKCAGPMLEALDLRILCQQQAIGGAGLRSSSGGKWFPRENGREKRDGERGDWVVTICSSVIGVCLTDDEVRSLPWGPIDYLVSRGLVAVDDLDWFERAENLDLQIRHNELREHLMTAMAKEAV